MWKGYVVCSMMALALAGSALGATYNVPGDAPTIQGAIDMAADGDSILVAAGTFEEQLNISKTLTIIGEGMGATTVLSPDQLTDYFPSSQNNYPIVYIHETDGVRIQDLTVDGAGRGNNNYRFVGIGFYIAGGEVARCEVTGVTDTPFSGAQHGNAIYVWNDQGSPGSVHVADCEIHDYQKGGVIVNGSVADAEVSSSSITGVGPTATIAQNGIQFGWGAAGTVLQCVVSDNVYTGPDWTSTGVLGYISDGMDVSGSTIDENQTGVYYISTSGLFLDNTITGSAGGAGQAGWWYGLGMDAPGPGAPAPEPFDGALEPGFPRQTTSVEIRDCLFQGDGSADNIGIGVWAQAGEDADAQVISCQILDWDYGIDVWDDGTAAPNLNAELSCFTGNRTYAVLNESTGPVVAMAANNWWGDPSGPSGAGPGTGDPVSENVVFEPWLTEDICQVATAVERRTWGHIKSRFR